MDNIKIISEMGRECFPCLYHELSKYGGSLLKKLVNLIQAGEQTQNRAIIERGKAWFFVSFSWLVAKNGGSLQSWCESLHYCAALGLIQIRTVTRKTLSPALQKSLNHITDAKHKPVNYYHIPAYTTAILEQAERKAQRFKEKGINRTGLTKGGVIEAIGQKHANAIYIDGRTKSKLERETEATIIRIMQEAITKHGYTLKGEILNKTAGALYRKYKMRWREMHLYAGGIWKNRSKALLSKAGAVYKRPTAEQKQVFSLQTNGWIITGI